MPANTLPIPTDEPQTIIDESDPTGDYELVNTGADAIVVNDRRADLFDTEGREIEPGRPAIVTKDKSGESVHAIADGLVDGEIQIEKTRFSIVKLPPMTLQGGRQNRSEFRTRTITTSAREAFESLPIPDGFDVNLIADPSNTDPVDVIDPDGGRLPLQPGASIGLGLSDLDVIEVEPVSGTQTIRATVEV